jgi:uncharacterized protein YutE (UPF0331/DUF86 family)
MDQLILAEKIESLRRCIKRIEDKKPESIDLLMQNLDLQDILVLNLTRAVQLSVDIGSHIISNTDELAPQTMGEVFTTLNKLGVITAETSQQLKKAVGFRNVAVHNYEAINWQIVDAICKNSLADFRRFSQEVSQYASL